jgi:HAD superfamily hydrolase (TIGR01490 family)
MNLAIYDLDKTITRRPTFTHFLLFFTKRHRPFRLALLPVWLVALIGYRIGFYGRKPLKQFGIAMFMGCKIPGPIIGAAASDFVENVVMKDLQPGAVAAIEADRKSGRRLVIATAAPEFYAREIGLRLGFDDVIATRHFASPDGSIRNRIDGENCYGAEKLRMVSEWLQMQNVEREQCSIAAYSDHPSDAPLLGWADKAYAINPNPSFAETAARSGWAILNFRDPA